VSGISVIVARRVDSPDLRFAGSPSLLRKEGGRKINCIFLSFVMHSITDLCRELRQRETPAEKVIWNHLRNRKLFGYKFLRQYPICVDSVFRRRLYYIPDFYCHQAKLVIEADGPIHLFKKDYDKNREEVLIALGLKILRFDNLQILNDTPGVLDLIKNSLPAPEDL
jgi:very-short-patch-repair endonuclease